MTNLIIKATLPAGRLSVIMPDLDAAVDYASRIAGSGTSVEISREVEGFKLIIASWDADGVPTLQETEIFAARRRMEERRGTSLDGRTEEIP